MRPDSVPKGVNVAAAVVVFSVVAVTVTVAIAVVPGAREHWGLILYRMTLM